MMKDPVALSMSEAVSDLMGEPALPVRWLAGGDESLVLQIEAAGNGYVAIGTDVRLSPDEVAWCHAVARHAQLAVPEVVVPLKRNGTTFVEWRGRCLALYPFVAGSLVCRTEPVHRDAAARLLAQIHRAILGWEGGLRPGSDDPFPTDGPVGMRDRSLEDWWNITRPDVLTSATHGDYYQRNLIWFEGRIAGVIDWHDAYAGSLAVELAGAAFEFCRDEAHVLDIEEAIKFVDAYRAAEGPVPDDEIADLLKFMRIWLRRDVALNLKCGTPPNDAYILRQQAAFRRLADQDWEIR